MGLLDDAIRQHLDLKRRHGADPSDVAKLEREAFGPIERPDALGVPGPVGEAPSTAGADTHETARDEELAYEEAELEAELAFEDAELETEGDRERTHPVDATALQAADIAGAPEPSDLTPVSRSGGSARFDPDAPAPERRDPQPGVAPGEHDELEETPEFLQETPEHDRLWFEQKPPRDFDF